MKGMPLIILVITILCIGLNGCSGAPLTPPVSSDTQQSSGNANESNSERMLWGVWEIGIDPGNWETTFELLRTGQDHYNITDMLIPPACDDCLTIHINSFNPSTRILDTDVTLSNATSISAYDVRGILFTDDYGHNLTNADGWTGLWEISGGKTINPFIAFAKSEDHRVFSGGAIHTENYLVYIPTPAMWDKITFAVDVSWPGNCQEPYEINNFSQAVIYDNVGSQGTVMVDVHDWQGDVNSVKLYTPEFTGLAGTQLTHQSGDTWAGTLKNTHGVEAGLYSARIVATSTGSGLMAMTYYTTVVIEHLNAPPTAAAHADHYDIQAGESVQFYDDSTDPEGYDDIVKWEWDFSYSDGIFNSESEEPNPYQQYNEGGIYKVQHQVTDSKGMMDPLDEPGELITIKVSSAGTLGWARTWGGNSADVGYGIVLDVEGNTFISGGFGTTVDFDPGPGTDVHASNGSTDIFFSKFNSDGEFQWVRTWGAYYADSGRDVAIDDSGNIYITGMFHGLADFDPGPGVDEHISSDGFEDVFLSKFDSNGEFLWARTWGGDYVDSANGVAVDLSGNVYVTGDFHHTADFDPGPGIDEHTALYGTEVFLSKFDPDGNFQWARNWGGSTNHFKEAVAIDPGGNAYVTGDFEYSADFDPGPGIDEFTSNGGSDIFLSKYDTDGNFLWARTWGGTNDDYGEGMDIDESGSIYVTGSFRKEVDFDPGNGIDEHTSSNYSNAFLSKFNSDGDFQWARTWGGDGSDFGNGVSANGNGIVDVTGQFVKTVDFDPGTGVEEHASNGESDIFLSKFDLDGNLIWVRTWGGNGLDIGEGVVIADNGNSYITGYFRYTVDFDPGPGFGWHTSNGDFDVFLCMYPPDGDW